MNIDNCGFIVANSNLLSSTVGLVFAGAGGGVESIGGLIGECLEEVSKMSGWSSSRVGELVSGKVLKSV